jgi:hypothetical protein
MEKNNLIDTIATFILFKLGEICLFILAVFVFHFIGNWILSFSFSPEILCYPKIMCESNSEFIFEYAMQTIIGILVSIVLLLLIIGLYYFIKWNWEMAGSN